MWTVYLSSNLNVECVDLRDNYLLWYLRVPPSKRYHVPTRIVGTWNLGTRFRGNGDTERKWKKLGWQEGGRRDMMGVKDNEISYSYLSFWVSYSSSWASSFSFLVYWIKPEVGWITLWGKIFRRMSRMLCYPATCSPQFMLQGTDISKEKKLEPPAPIFPWGCGHWAVFCSSTENLRQLSKNLPTTNSATITIWEGFLDICCWRLCGPTKGNYYHHNF